MSLQPTSQTWSLYNEAFFFEASQTQNHQGETVITLQIHRTNFPDTVIFEGTVTSTPSSFCSSFEDRVNVRGTLSLIQLSAEETGVWLDVFYGPHLFKRFEGVIFIFEKGSHKEEEIVIPIDVEDKPPIIPNKDATSQTKAIVIKNEEFSDLFHFSGLRLPGLLPNTDRERFIVLKNNSPYFLALQKAAQSENAAPALEKLANERAKSPAFIQRAEVITAHLFELIALYDRLLRDPKSPDISSVRIILVDDIPLFVIKKDDVWTRTLNTYLTDISNDYLSQIILLLSPDDPSNSAAETNLLEEYTLVLRLMNYFECIAAYGSADSKEALRAIVSLPDEIMNPLLSEKEAPGNIQALGIGALMSVQQKVLRYEVGDIAFIENVMPGERIERQRRELHQEDQIEEDLLVHHRNQDRQNQNSVDYDLLNQLITPNGSPSWDFAYGAEGEKKEFTPSSETLTGGWSLTLNPEQNLFIEAYRFAQNMMGKAVSGMWKETRKKRSSTIRHHVETLASQIIDNQQGKQELRGIYRWINQVLGTRVMDQGQHLIVEFIVDEPGKGLTPPSEDLAPDLPSGLIFAELDFTDLSWEEYLNYAAELNLETLIPLPPQERQLQSILQWEPAVNNLQIEIPEDYEVTQAAVSYLHDGTSLDGYLGTQQFSTAGQNCPTPESVKGANLTTQEESDPAILTVTSAQGSPPTIPQPPGLFPGAASGGCKAFTFKGATGALPVMIFTDAQHYYVNVGLVCQLSQERFQEWQLQAYLQIKKAFAERALVKKDNKGVKALQAKQRDLIVKTLESRAIDLLEQQLFSTSTPAELSGYRQLLQTAFRWKELTYQLVKTPPEAQENDLPTDSSFRLSFENNSQSPDLHQFLTADQAVVQVAVRNAHELGALYTIWTRGLLWPGLKTDAPILDSLQFYANELVFDSHPHPGNNKSWEVRTPTSLLILDSETELSNLK